MNNNNQTFVVVCLMIYIRVKLTFICIYLDYIKKIKRLSKIIFLKTKKVKRKYINALKIE